MAGREELTPLLLSCPAPGRRWVCCCWHCCWCPCQPQVQGTCPLGLGTCCHRAVWGPAGTDSTLRGWALCAASEGWVSCTLNPVLIPCCVESSSPSVLGYLEMLWLLHVPCLPSALPCVTGIVVLWQEGGNRANNLFRQVCNSHSVSAAAIPRSDICLCSEWVGWQIQAVTQNHFSSAVFWSKDRENCCWIPNVLSLCFYCWVSWSLTVQPGEELQLLCQSLWVSQKSQRCAPSLPRVPWAEVSRLTRTIADTLTAERSMTICVLYPPFYFLFLPR